MSDLVEHPNHYTQAAGRIEPIDFVGCSRSALATSASTSLGLLTKAMRPRTCLRRHVTLTGRVRTCPALRAV